MAAARRPSRYQAALLLELVEAGRHVELVRAFLPMIFNRHGSVQLTNVRCSTLSILHQRGWVRLQGPHRLFERGARLYLTDTGRAALETRLGKEAGTLT